MPVPADSKYPKLRFSCHGFELCIALFDFDSVNWPGIVYPSLLKLLPNNTWQQIDARDAIWNDQKEEFDEPFMANLIVADFNQTIALLAGGTELTYEQKLAAEIVNGFKVVNNQLVRV